MITCVRESLEGSPLKAAPVIFDALHTQYHTLTIIEEASDTHITQVKENQKELLEGLKDHLPISRPSEKPDTLDKAHGRLEHRQGRFYHISGIAFNSRWGPCCPSTLIVVDRQRARLRTGRVTTERSFHVPNRPVQGIGARPSFDAIRGHWQIEGDHYLRDTTVREDRIECPDHQRIKTISTMITLANDLL